MSGASLGDVLRLAALPAALCLQLAAGQAPGLVEEFYSRRVYPVAAGALERASGARWLPVGEWLVALALIGVGAWCLKARRRARRSGAAALQAALRALWIGLGSLWLCFLGCWSLNFQRLPFAVSAGLDMRPSSLAELRAVCQSLIGDSNVLRTDLPEHRDGSLRLVDGPRSALARVGRGFAAAAKRHPFVEDAPHSQPKLLSSSALFSYLGITGVYLPFTAEAYVNSTLPDVELPFSASHETAHRLGFAREDEANYLGYLACRLHPDRDFRYAGTLGASAYALAALGRVDPVNALELSERRSPAVRRDLRALADWSKRYRSRAADVGHAVNDAFLRSQGQRDGLRSYGRMVDLLIAEQRQAGN